MADSEIKPGDMVRIVWKPFLGASEKDNKWINKIGLVVNNPYEDEYDGDGEPWISIFAFGVDHPVSVTSWSPKDLEKLA
jgi:hypothetical protein